MTLLTRHTDLPSQVIAFCRYLRTKGFVLGPAEEADALLALTVLPMEDREQFRLALRAVLTRSLLHQRKFDDLYEEYWAYVEQGVDSKVRNKETPRSQAKKKQQKPSLQALKSWLYGNKQEEEAELAVYSPAEVLGRKDFGAFSDEELEEVMKLIAIMARNLASSYSRRFLATHRPGQFDLKRTIRLNLRRGGEIAELGFRKRKMRKLRMVLLCDVSKSMDLYSRFLIQFIYAFQKGFRHIETFVFSTSLHRITEELRTYDFSLAMEALADKVPEWSGGTQIGTSFETFVKDYGSRLLDPDTVVLVMSDGWDMGEGEVLGKSMRSIQRKAGKVIWLNPLAGNAAFEPTVKGMQAAWPYIDVFAPAHNVESLRNVIQLIR